MEKRTIKKPAARAAARNLVSQSVRVGTSKKKPEGKSEEFSVEMVDISTIFLWGGNPRMNDKASMDLAKIIKAHGVRSPIICWDKNRTIYKGNTTYKACRILGMKKVPVVFHSFPSEAAAKAYGIADNKASELAGWDDELLLKIMGAEEFKSANFETGFSESEQKIMIKNMAKAAAAEIEEKEFDGDIETNHKCPRCSYEW